MKFAEYVVQTLEFKIRKFGLVSFWHC